MASGKYEARVRRDAKNLARSKAAAKKADAKKKAAGIKDVKRRSKKRGFLGSTW
jgi:hypothetical protein